MSSHLRRNWTGYCLLVLLVAGFAVRLLFALPDLDARRFWDERVSLWNVRSLVAERQVRPHNGFYPTLSYLPHAAVIAATEGVHRATGAEPLRMLDPEGRFGFTEGAVLAARLVSVAVGTLTLAFVFLLGRRLASPLVGLVAAAIVSASWTHLFVSVKFKPDVLAVAVAILAFWWILDAVERPGAGRFALAGLGVGLSASTKFLGVSLAIPLVAAALFSAGRELRTWGRVALAGATTIGTFLALNPWLHLIVRDLSRTQADYAAKAARAGATHWTVLLEEARWIVQDHRPVVALFVVLGCAGLVLRAAGRPGAPPGRVQAVAVLAAIFGHSVFYALSTAHFRDWNYLPVLPFTAFAGAWAMVGTAGWAAARLPERARAPLGAALWVPVLLFFLAFPLSLTYTATVPTTWEVASRSLDRLDAASARIVYGEDARAEIERRADPSAFLFLEVEDLGQVRPAELARADAVVFAASELEAGEEGFHRRWMESEERAVSRVEPRWFRSRGPSLVLVRHGWELAEPVVEWPVEAAAGGRFTLPLERPLARGEMVSLALRVERRGAQQLPGALGVAGAGEAALYRLGPGRMAWMVTPKFRMRRRAGRLVLELRGPAPSVEPRAVKLYRWQAPAPSAPAG